MRLKKSGYFEKIPGAPEPVTFTTKRRVSFNEVDVMGIVWYGNYAVFFEQAQTELGRHCGLSYQDYYVLNLRAPIVKFHADYYQPLCLDEEFSIKASYIWCEGAKLYIEYTIIKADATIATRGYTVQMFIDGVTNQPFIVAPEILERLRKRWKNGEFKCLK